MRDFLLNSEEQLDREALAFLQQEGQKKGLLSCEWVRFNKRIKLAYFTDSLKTLSERMERMSLDDICNAGKKIIRIIEKLEDEERISLESAVWDPDGIYMDTDDNVFLICLPAALPAETRHSQIYVKRVYALLEDIVSQQEGGDMVCRQIVYQKEKAFGNWNMLMNALDRRAPEEDEVLVLKSINTPEVLTFRVHHEDFRIGTDPEAEGLIKGVDTISPLHAMIGWNEISFFVKDLGSTGGTFVNDTRLTPNMEVPIGQGTVLRFADCTFNVE